MNKPNYIKLHTPQATSIDVIAPWAGGEYFGKRQHMDAELGPKAAKPRVLTEGFAPHIGRAEVFVNWACDTFAPLIQQGVLDIAGGGAIQMRWTIEAADSTKTPCTYVGLATYSNGNFDYFLLVGHETYESAVGPRTFYSIVEVANGNGIVTTDGVS